jgi:hypothetical protein
VSDLEPSFQGLNQSEKLSNIKPPLVSLGKVGKRNDIIKMELYTRLLSSVLYQTSTFDTPLIVKCLLVGSSHTLLSFRPFLLDI